MGREYSRGRGYSRWAGPGIFPPAGDIPNGGRGYSPPARDMTDRAGNIPAGRGYSQWGPGISPPAGDIPDGPGDIPAGRGYSRSGREYSRRPGIFPTGPRIRGSRERSWSPAGIFPAGRGYPRLARGHDHGLAALEHGACLVTPQRRASRKAHARVGPDANDDRIWGGLFSHGLLYFTRNKKTLLRSAPGSYHRRESRTHASQHASTYLTRAGRRRARRAR